MPTRRSTSRSRITHNIGRDPNTTYLQTAFKSDVHVADCTFENTAPGQDQAFADDVAYSNAAGTT
jgi:hypothetical protein